MNISDGTIMIISGIIYVLGGIVSYFVPEGKPETASGLYAGIIAIIAGLVF